MTDGATGGKYWWALVAAALALGAASSRRASDPAGGARNGEAEITLPRGSLSVLTYNVEGLPWPLALGRGAALDRIAERLAAMRRAGRAPAVVVLQEAFVSGADALAVRSGYRWTATGPGAADLDTPAVAWLERDFVAAASWWKGERSSKLVGSGLRILSDYPIARVARAAFPVWACAGFDCLANKGMLMVTVVLPGAPAPVDVVTVHLNSRRASGVDDARSLHAYRLQVAALGRFVRAHRGRGHALVVAGDLNVGRSIERRAAILAVASEWSTDRVARDALSAANDAGVPLPPDARWSRRRAKDWQFFDGGTRASMAVDAISAPFGRDRSGAMLSDHVGYAATYRFVSAVTTQPSRTASRCAGGQGCIAARS